MGLRCAYNDRQILYLCKSVFSVLSVVFSDKLSFTYTPSIPNERPVLGKLITTPW